MNSSNNDDYDEKQPASKEEQDVEFLKEEAIKIEELLNLNAANFTNGLGEIVFDTSFEFSKEENINVQINDTESNIDKKNWDPEKDTNIMLD
ncbi:36507_t:CDS:1, partial [Gigaspora margarita]